MNLFAVTVLSFLRLFHHPRRDTYRRIRDDPPVRYQQRAAEHWRNRQFGFLGGHDKFERTKKQQFLLCAGYSSGTKYAVANSVQSELTQLAFGGEFPVVIVRVVPAQR
jgi:hypothetical protein